MKLEIIKDPTRLKEGDLIVVPSEADRTRKRLHLSVSTIGGHGVSYGFTGRSDNKAETVRRMLTDDTGKPRVFFVCDTRQRHHWDDNRRKYGDLLGPSRTLVKNELPEISWASFAELPSLCPAADEDASCLLWKSVFQDSVASALTGLPREAFVSNYAPEERRTDAYARLVYDSWLSREERGNGDYGSLDDNLPERNFSIGGWDKPADGTDLDAFVSSYVFAFDRDYKPKDHMIGARARFFEWYKASGAVFLRPDGEWRDMMARHVAAHLMTVYANRCRKVMASFKGFLTGLKGDAETMSRRGKGAIEMAGKLALRKKERDKLYKGLK